MSGSSSCGCRRTHCTSCCPQKVRRGATGATGATSVGATGATGIGSPGATGATGAGATGVGATGATGVGSQGATGATGAGATGVGATGATGVGLPGATGATGATGAGATGVSLAIAVLDAYSRLSQTVAPLGTVLFDTIGLDESGPTFDYVAPDTVRFNDPGLYEITYGLQVQTIASPDGAPIFGAMINGTTVIPQSQRHFSNEPGFRLETVKFAYRSAGGGELLTIRNLSNQIAELLSVDTEDMSSFIVVDRLGP